MYKVSRKLKNQDFQFEGSFIIKFKLDTNQTKLVLPLTTTWEIVAFNIFLGSGNCPVEPISLPATLLLLLTFVGFPTTTTSVLEPRDPQQSQYTKIETLKIRKCRLFLNHNHEHICVIYLSVRCGKVQKKELCKHPSPGLRPSKLVMPLLDLFSSYDHRDPSYRAAIQESSFELF